MAKRMLIDAAHPEETRVVVLSGNRLEEFDFESSTKRKVKGNIYLAKVTRVEPSLQAAFVDYGGNRHGFLAFSEIHPDYYRIPVSDRSRGNGEPHDAAEQPSANGADEAGVPIDAALPEPVPVPASTAAADEETPARDAAFEDNLGERHDVAGDPGYEPTAPTEPGRAGPFGGMPPTDWERPEWEPHPGEPAAEPSERHEPERVSWHDETPFHAAPSPDVRSGDSAAQWGDQSADYAQSEEARPEAIALRASEESVVAAEIADVAVNGDAAESGTGTVETFGGDEVEEVEEADAERRRRYPGRHYKIQEVIKRRQIMLVQVAKEERGNKGA